MKFGWSSDDTPTTRIRLWPGVAAVTLQWLVRYGLLEVAPEAAMYAVLGGFAGGLVVLIWWVFFSRASRLERWGGAGLLAVALLVTTQILHESVATGARGMLFPLFATPVISLGLVAGAVVASRLHGRARLAALAATILAACGGWALVRTDGFIGDASAQWAWRWSPTQEERLLASAGLFALPAPRLDPPKPEAKEPAAPAPKAKPRPATPAAPRSEAASPGPEWPGFRGQHRDGVVRHSRVRTDWTASPPVELWRRPVGPGWSSFAVQGDFIYTQEQRGEFEFVACYRLATGEPVWAHRDPARFWESNGGAGPRATPTLSGGRVYSFGATGILNALEAASGATVWRRDVASDTDTKIPAWGFSSSPLILDGSVIVAASGKLSAYDLPTGNPRWVVPTGGGGYSSPHLMTIGGVAQVLLLTSAGVTSVAPADGAVLWKHSWTGSTILQPAATLDGGILITSNDPGGGSTRRLSVTRGPDGWSAEERWTSKGLKPYFNDFVVHKGHAYGFDGTILSCIDLKDGSRKWKGGRFGHGQLVLLADQDLLLVLSEEGELALIGAAPGQFKEISRLRAMEGKTWNHPVLAGDVLLVRNGEEMVAFRLPQVGG